MVAQNTVQVSCKRPLRRKGKTEREKMCYSKCSLNNLLFSALFRLLHAFPSMIPLVVVSLALTFIPVAYSANITAVHLPSIWETVNSIGPQVRHSSKDGNILYHCRSQLRNCSHLLRG